MTNATVSKYNFLQDYLKRTYEIHHDDSIIEDLKESDPTLYQEIQKAKTECARLEVFLDKENHNYQTNYQHFILVVKQNPGRRWL